MDKGNLQEFIQKRKWTTEELIEMSRQIATGMSYLADRKIVHRYISLLKFCPKLINFQ